MSIGNVTAQPVIIQQKVKDSNKGQKVGTGVGLAAGSAAAIMTVNTGDLSVSTAFDYLKYRLDPKEPSYSKILSESETMRNTYIKDMTRHARVKSYITAGLLLLGCAAAGFGIGSLFNKSGTLKAKENKVINA